MAKKKVLTDFGNHDSKVCIPRGRDKADEYAFPSVVAKVDWAQFEAARNRGKTSRDGFFVMGNQPFVVGKEAIPYLGDRPVLRDASRYTKDWIGALLSYSLLLGIWTKQNEQGFDVMLGHTPRDIGLQPKLRAAVSDVYDLVAIDDKGVDVDIRYRVNQVDFYDEPLGSFFLGAMRHPDLRKGTTLVIDTGGGTTALTRVRDGDIDYENAMSINHGILDLENSMITAMNANHDLHDQVLDMDPSTKQSVVRTLLRDGKWESMSGNITMKQGFDLIVNKFFIDIEEAAKALGGIGSARQLLLTGGGTIMLYKKYRARWGGGNIYIPGVLDDIYMSNVRGSRIIKAAIDAMRR